MRIFTLALSLGFLLAIFISILIYLPTSQITLSDFTHFYHDTYFRQIIGFTLLQASISAFLSIGFAIPIARAIFRQYYYWRHLIKILCLFIFVFPSVLIVFALINLHGISGIFNDLFNLLGIKRSSYLYGIVGILLGHIFFNLPLALFIFIAKLEEIPIENWQSAKLLKFTDKDYWLHLEYPALRHTLIPLCGIIFTLCTLSFTVILNLGGKPRFNTLEVAIYQAIKYDFDLTLAAQLGMIQLFFCILALGLPIFLRKQNFTYTLTHAPIHHDHKASRQQYDSYFQQKIRFDGDKLSVKLFDHSITMLFIILILLPLISVVIPPNLNFHLPHYFAQALITSIMISSISTIISLILCLSLVIAAQSYRNFSELILFFGYATFIMPPLLLATGLWLAFHWLPHWILVVIINALMALPIMLRIIAPPAFQIYDNQKHLITLLNFSGYRRLKLIDFPQLKEPLSLAISFVFCLSFGDLSGIALFGGDDLITLPFLIFTLMNSYHLNEAFMLASFMLLIYLLIFKGIQYYAHHQ